ncbi:MAG TPA: ABC transporter permease [Steroidobacteraceae bacterium]|nr:ABC transporter permease [Steroidobacteraceae bacterium]
MKFLPLIWAGIRRKRSRSILILAQVVIAFTLFGVLQGLNSGIKHAVAASHADRLYVSSRLRLGAPLPISILAPLKTTPGIVQTTYRYQFGATYQKVTQGVPILATDIESFLEIYPELQVDPAAIQRMKQTQDGAIVGTETMSKYGWKIGQRVTLQSPLQRKDGTGNWSFEIVGTYVNQQEPDSSVLIMTNYRYVNESLPTGRDTIMLAVVRIADPTRTGALEQAIDAQFANSSNETLTQSESELSESSVANLGDLNTVAQRITVATFFVLLFATGALMMQSIRERTPELAVLKTVGFSDRLVMLLILSESVVLCLAGAALGLWIASRILPLARALIGLGSVPPIILVVGFACALGLALASAAIPAWRGLRLRVVDALAGR